MKKKMVLVLVIMILSSFVIYCNKTFAAGTTMNSLLKSKNMKDVSTPDASAGQDGIIGGINSVIGLLQFAGTGISVIVVTILGIKYILASPADKADVKKSIMPIIIGCALLFAGVNIVATVMDFSTKVFSNI